MSRAAGELRDEGLHAERDGYADAVRPEAALNPTSPYRRVVIAASMLVGANLALAAGYWLLNLDRTNPDGTPIGYVQCLYMTVISTFTVGYGEAVPVLTTTDRIYTMIVITIGIGMIGYGLSQMTAFLVEGELHEMLERRTMEKTISKLEGHYIICGMGETGHYVAAELITTKRSVVVIDTDEARLKKLVDELQCPYLVGDAMDDAVLERAGVRHAAGVVCALPHDRDNLYLAVTCRQINSSLRIVAKAEEVHLAQRIRKAGADAVVSPQFIGGLRLASELVRPTVVTFLDQMLRDTESATRIEEIRVEQNSRTAGKALKDLDLPKLLVMAVRPSGADKFEHVPRGETVLEPGSTLVVLGEAECVAKLRAEASAG